MEQKSFLNRAGEKHRHCIRCDKWKPESDFNTRNALRGYLQSVCKDCQQAQMRERYATNPDRVKAVNKASRHTSREIAHEYVYQYLLTHPCADCGEADPVVLTFDHRPGTKKDNIADLVTQGRPIERIKAEMEKCEVVCHNCHNRRTQKERGTFRWTRTNESQD